MTKNYILFLLSILFVGTINAQVTLTQSVDPVTVDDGGVACWDQGSGEYRENSFFRAYNLADFGVVGDFEISSVEYGQGSASDGKIITLNIYTATSDDLSTATLTLIQSASHTSSATGDLALISVPLVATIPAGSTIAFEVMAGDSGTNTGETYFPGLNSGGENDDSYIKSASCNIDPPATATSIGFPDNQYVMNVVGTDLLSVDEFSLSKISISPNPTVDFVNIDMGVINSDFTVSLYNVTGQLVLEKVNQTKLNVSELNSGVYLLKIESENASIARKIVKK